MSKSKNLKTDFRTPDKWLVLGLMAGPLSALLNVTISYILVPEACVRGTKTILHVSFAAFLLLALAGAGIGWRLRKRFPAGEDRLHERIRWMANAAIILSLGSALMVLATEIPNVVLRSCD